ncbi:MAG: 4-(cytidine 5'-diphospho)-2-C-methyl-D-erythritol kinase [Gammaproteobacteria bacterium]|nr:4-(cytidine 5'-diphospho)-2-C-methyl-D-erythritol kinase [Gammaproteobacteria bacterium]
MDTAIDWQNPDFEWLAPAKLNLFLHITGRRADGYHLLQSVFQFLEYGDSLRFQILESPEICIEPAIPEVSLEDNIIYKAAMALKQKYNISSGARISLIKRLPMGGGLGGGSSDAATTLLALNRLWNLNLTKQTLMEIGLTLGADVPVFIFGHSAWAEGVGEKLEAVNLPEKWFLTLFPNIHINTGTIFSSSELTRDKDPIKIRDFLQGATENVCQPVVEKHYPEVTEALNWLNQFSPARLTGTGACIFAAFDSKQAALTVSQQVPDKWQHFVAKGLNKTPIEQFYWGIAKR